MRRDMQIRNVKILTPEGSFKEGVVYTGGDRISTVVYSNNSLNGEIFSPEEVLPGSSLFEDTVGYQTRTRDSGEKKGRREFIDGQGAFLLPGMIDLHFHGCKGDDFCDGTQEALRRIAEYETSIGVTAICPATMTLSVDELKGVLWNAAEFAAGQKGAAQADLLGVNMEGPFISPVKRGAQDESKIIPRSSEVFAQLQKAAQGLVRFIAIAPEEPGVEPVEDFIANVRGAFPQTSVSLAHTNANYDQAMAAFEAGANHAVHLFNAMPAFAHRAPGVVGAVSDSEHVMAEMICDGIHIHPAVVRAAFKMLGKDRIILISDSMRATGMPDGRYTLGGLDVDVHGKHATMVRDGALAGSVTSLPDCVRTLVREMGIPLETAAICATRNPARSLGPDIEREYGTIEPGKRADLVLWDENLKLRAVIKDGKLITHW